MTKADFIAGVAEVAGISKKDAGIALEAVLSQLTTAFSKGEDVSFVGFGTFKVSTRKARVGRNPSTGKEIQIPESKTVGFKVGKGLKEKLETEQQKNLELKVENSVILTNNKQLKSLLDTPVVISFTKGILSKDNQVLTCSVSELPTLLNKMLNEKFTVVKITY